MLLAPVLASSAESGPVSVYRPGDGMNSGQLACGGSFLPGQRHIAHRRWRSLGCGRPVLVVSRSTGSRVLATVRDAGPFGIVEVLPRAVKRKPRWRVWTQSLRAPLGWRWRGAVDLSYDLWLELGRPRFLTTVTMYFLPWGILRKCEDLLRRYPVFRSLLNLQSRSGFDQLAQALQNMKLRRGSTHLSNTAGSNAYLLRHSLVVDTEKIDASNKIARHSSTMPRFDVPDRLFRHACEYSRNWLGNPVAV